MKRFILGAGLVLVASFAAVMFFSKPAGASMATNSVLRYGNSWNFCTWPAYENEPPYYALGGVWLSNDDSDYYAQSVNIPTNANTTRVTIRGAANSCATDWSGARTIYAVDVKADLLTGLEGDSFSRGRVPGGVHWTWSSQGSKLGGWLNVSGVAPCGSPESFRDGYSMGQVIVSIARRQQQYDDWGNRTYNSPTVGIERVTVAVRRTCPQYNYNLTPSVASTAAGSIEAPKSNFPVTGTVTKSGATASRAGANWRLTQLVYKDTGAVPASLRSLTTSAQSVLPCQHATGELECTDVDTGAATYTAASTPYARNAAIKAWPVGTNICFMMSVRAYTQTTEDWRHSALLCYKVGVKPKVNVLGGDLIIRGPTTGTVVSTATSEDITAGRTYGSWVEYGLVASGVVNGMASGSGYAGGASNSDLCRQSLLTFKNYNKTATSGACSVGGYSMASTSSALTSRFPVNGTTIPNNSAISPSSLAKQKVHTVGGAALRLTAGTLNANEWVVINAPNTDVTITGDLNYGTAALPNIKSIPQLVIIARSISIDASVTNIDAWLVASSGSINTCSAVPNGHLSNAASDKSRLSSRICDRPLTVNGPIITSHLYMYRTANAASGANAGRPAEVFNLRPDAYLWGIGYNGGGRIPTVETKDLPPRF